MLAINCVAKSEAGSSLSRCISALLSSGEFIRLCSVDKFNNINVQGLGNSRKDGCGWIAYTALNAANIATVKSAIGRKIFLGDAALLPHPP